MLHWHAKVMQSWQCRLSLSMKLVAMGSETMSKCWHMECWDAFTGSTAIPTKCITWLYLADILCKRHHHWHVQNLSQQTGSKQNRLSANLNVRPVSRWVPLSRVTAKAAHSPGLSGSIGASSGLSLGAKFSRTSGKNFFTSPAKASLKRVDPSKVISPQAALSAMAWSQCWCSLFKHRPW